MKKIFYNKRHKVPAWSQIYLAWLVIFLIGFLWISRIEIVHYESDLIKSYDYIKSYDTISSLHLKTLNNYPDSHEFNRTLINTVKSDIHDAKWNIEEINYDFRKLKCKFTRYFIENEQNDLLVIFDHNNISKTFYLLQTLVQGLINENVRHVSITSVQGNPVCTEYLLKKYTQNTTNNPRYLYLYGARENKPGLQVINSSGNFSSILWSSIIPDSMIRPGILKQLGAGTIPLFQKLFFNEISSPLNGIGWSFPEEIYQSEINSVHNIVPPLLFTIKNYNHIKSNEIQNNVWLSSKSALSTRGSIIFSCLMVILIWLPVANKLYQGESIRHILTTVFSALYNSLPFFIAAILIKIFSSFMPTSLYGSLIIFGVFIFLVWFMNKIQKSMFNFNINSLTEFLIVIIFASFLAFNNHPMFIFSIPLIFAASKKSTVGYSTFQFLLFLSLIPIMYALYLTGSLLSYQDLANHVSLVWMQQTIFSNLATSSMFFLLCGSLFTIAHESK